jgi:hypothetical protein
VDLGLRLLKVDSGPYLLSVDLKLFFTDPNLKVEYEYGYKYEYEYGYWYNFEGHRVVVFYGQKSTRM